MTNSVETGGTATQTRAQVRRYDPDVTGEGWNFGDASPCMEESAQGEYVLASDYDALAEQHRAKLRRLYERIQATGVNADGCMTLSESMDALAAQVVGLQQGMDGVEPFVAGVVAQLAEAQRSHEADREVYHELYMALHHAGRDPYLGALEQAKAIVAERDEMRNVLIDMRCYFHAQGRRPEECWHMSRIDAALERT